MAVAILEKQGYACWWSAKTKFHESDIFGIADLICSNKQGIKLIQLTTLSNVSARRKKINKVLEKMELGCPIEVWGMGKDKTFKIVRIY